MNEILSISDNDLDGYTSTLFLKELFGCIDSINLSYDNFTEALDNVDPFPYERVYITDLNFNEHMVEWFLSSFAPRMNEGSIVYYTDHHIYVKEDIKRLSDGLSRLGIRFFMFHNKDRCAAYNVLMQYELWNDDGNSDETSSKRLAAKYVDAYDTYKMHDKHGVGSFFEIGQDLNFHVHDIITNVKREHEVPLLNDVSDNIVINFIRLYLAYICDMEDRPTIKEVEERHVARTALYLTYDGYDGSEVTDTPVSWEVAKERCTYGRHQLLGMLGAYSYQYKFDVETHEIDVPTPEGESDRVRILFSGSNIPRRVMHVMLHTTATDIDVAVIRTNDKVGNMYQTEYSPIDLSTIAKSLNGGGHVNASGFPLSKLSGVDEQEFVNVMSTVFEKRLRFKKYRK